MYYSQSLFQLEEHINNFFEKKKLGDLVEKR